MVQHRLGHADAARDGYRAAIALYAWDADSAIHREAWMYQILRREAESLLASTPIMRK
jgi:hypothetical protein